MIKLNNNKEEGHNTGSDRYLITYADLITLLLGLFVVFYASAQVDQEKFKEFSAAFSEFFRAKDDKILQGGDGVLEANRQGVPEPILPPITPRSITDIEKEIREKFNQYISNNTLILNLEDSTLRISLTEKLLFRSGKAEIEQLGLIALDSLSEILKNINYTIYVDGHTDSDPIRTFQYESNWHLSVARSTNVAYKLIRNGVPEYNIVIRGFGSQRPIADNTTPEGKSLNRRVDILLIPPDNLTPNKKAYIEKNEIII